MTNTPSSSWMLNATGLDSNTSHNQLSRIPLIVPAALRHAQNIHLDGGLLLM